MYKPIIKAMVTKTEIKYKGFIIRTDNYYGYSLYNINNGWCQSSPNVELLKGSVECILLADKKLTVDQYWKAKNVILNKYCNNSN